ncbi:GNAT family N-acetyltransferase [Pararhizobium sp. LjRoot238]|uniref:GNAT family N-acetyltransferase n=1 Tax=Pararhizobium sp. LjRoot238 TaxID=3342293 RepID=UPI003ED14493
MQPDPAIAFTAVDESHMPMLFGWLSEAHVRRWWDEPHTALKRIREGSAAGKVERFVFSVNGEPAGYIQSWLPTQYDSEPWAKDLTPDTPGIDIFVGPPEMTGKGVAPAVIRAFATRLFSGTAPRIIIDPDAENKRALRAYAKAGFTPYGEWNESTGRTILMELTRTEFERMS